MTPGGNSGTSIAIPAYNEKQAVYETQSRLSVGTGHDPSEFKIIKIEPMPKDSTNQINTRL